MGPDRPGKHYLFEVPAAADEIRDRFPVTDADDILCNDRALIQIGSHVMARCPDKLDSALVCLVIGARPGKGGKERVVDVDDLLRVLVDERVTKYLHVTGQHEGVDCVTAEQFQFCGFLFSFVVRGNGEMGKAYPKAIRGTAEALPCC